MASEVRLARLGADGKWQQIAYTGSWYYHDGRPFQFTEETFQSIIRNFESRGGEALPFKYGHAAGSAEASYYGAAGWISALEIRPDAQGRVSLYAQVDWKDRARGMIQRDELRYASVEVVSGRDTKTDESTGPELVGVAALVDLPFLEGMEPLAAQRHIHMAKQMTEAQLLADIVKELGKDATMEKVQRIFAAKKALQDAYGSPEEAEAAAADVAASAAPPVVKASKDEPKDLEGAPADKVDLEEDAPPAEGAGDPVAAIETIAEMPLAEVAAKIAEAPDAFRAFLAGEMAAPSEEPPMDMADVETVSQLSAQVRKLEKSSREATDQLTALKTEHAIDLAIRDGLVVEAERAFLVKLGKAGLLEEHLEGRKAEPSVQTKRVLGRKSPTKTEATDWDRDDPNYVALSKQFGQVLKLKGDALHERVVKTLSARSGSN